MSQLNFAFSRQVPLLLQNEGAECGLACLAMIAGFYGHHVDLASLRSLYSISLKGTTLLQIMDLAQQLKFSPRALRLDLEHMSQLKLPCILHWEFNHFVVLTQVKGNSITIHDPAIGKRQIERSDYSKYFTGIALELTPNHEFAPKKETRSMSLFKLIGKLPKMGAAITQVLILAFVLQLFSILGPFFMQWVVDHALVTQDRNLIVVLAIGFLLLAIIQTAVTALRAWLIVILGTSMNLQLMRNLFRHLIHLPMSWFDKRHIGDVMSRFESLNTIQRTLTASFLEAVIDGVMVLITLGMMLLYSIKLAIVAIVAALLYGLLSVALYRPLKMTNEEQIIRLAKQQSHFLESIRGMQCIKLFAHEEQRSMRWQNLVIDQFNAGIRTQRLSILYQTLNGFLFGIENVVTIWLGALLVLDTAQGSGFSIGMLFAFVSYKTQFIQRIASLIEKILELRMLGLHTERIADIALTPIAPHPTQSYSSLPTPNGDIEISNLSFRYADNDPFILHDVNLTIKEGESLAIVGPSGCGKTTLIKLILGLMYPTNGKICVGGHTLNQIGLSQYHAKVASVMQDDQLFAGSISENICFFEPCPNHEKIAECARLAGIYDDIDAMPMQFNTLVGDMGTVLSGGQKQQIILARALYREPKILVLDEATSHLDIAREKLVNDAVQAMKLTRIIVAHRPETIASADRIIMLSDGKIMNAESPLVQNKFLTKAVA